MKKFTVWIHMNYGTYGIEYDTFEEACAGKERLSRKSAFSRYKMEVVEA